MKNKKYNHIELFAGCGGLALGMERTGFALTLANEMSPMASESFAYNLLGEDLKTLAENGSSPQKTFWLSTKHEDLSSRLRENPLEYPPLSDGLSTIPKDFRDAKHSLLVGNIIHLNQLLSEKPEHLKMLKTAFGEGEVDLVSGGPPCQSFSMAGMRRRDCSRNTLPWEFAKFVGLVKPKIALLENVTGILRAFTEGGRQYHAWFEVAKAFALVGYLPLCLHVNARYSGVPQNRPRFIMIAVRGDVFANLKSKLSAKEKKLFVKSEHLFERVNSGNEDIEVEEFGYLDASNGIDLTEYTSTFLGVLLASKIVSVEEALDDLKFATPSPASEYMVSLNKTFSSAAFLKSNKHLFNHEPRKNNDRVQRRFRIYQVLQECGKMVTKEVFAVLKGAAEDISNNSWQRLEKKQFLAFSGRMARFKTKKAFVEYLQKHPTKKQTQKALDASSPAPAALSIPDDACHYDTKELRTLTVREMARIQSFPDNFVFRSKITTGGQMRRFEVPQYTQVGNAVPPLLGYALGRAVKELLDRLKD